MIRNLRLIFILMFSLAVLSAQEPWTLERCILHAMEYNLDLKQQGQFLKTAKLRYEHNKLNRLPNLNGRGGVNYNMGRSIDDNNAITFDPLVSNSFSLGSSVGLFSGFRQHYRTAASRYFYSSQMVAQEKAKKQLAMEVMALYLEVLYKNELCDVALDQLRIAQNDSAQVSALISVGKREPVAIYEMQALVSEIRTKLSSHQQGYKLSLLSLEHLIEYSDNAPFSVGDLNITMSQPISHSYLTDSVFRVACDVLPRMQQLTLEMKGLEQYVKAAKGSLWPSLSANGGIGTQYYSKNSESYQNQLNENLNTYVGMGLNVNLFNGLQVRKQVEQEQIVLETKFIAFEQERRRLFKDIESTVQQLQMQFATYESALLHKTYVEKNFEIQREKLRLGLITSNDLFVLQTRLLDAKIKVLAARYDWMMQEKMVLFYLGN